MRNGVEHPLQIPVVGAGAGLKNDPSAFLRDGSRVWLHPAPRLGVAVREGQHRAVVVPRGRKADPRPLRGAEQRPLAGVRAEGTLLNALGVFVDENEGIRCGRILHVPDLVPAIFVHALVRVVAEIHIHVHRHTADAGNLALVANSRLVGGTLVDAGGVVVLEEGALAYVRVIHIGVGVAVKPRGALTGPTGPAASPRELGVGRHAIVVIPGVHRPAKL